MKYMYLGKLLGFDLELFKKFYVIQYQILANSEVMQKNITKLSMHLN